MIKKGNTTIFWGYVGTALQVLTAMGFVFDPQAFAGGLGSIPYIVSGVALGIGVLVHSSRRKARGPTS